MFDGLFKPKFYTKCKSLVKITKTRIETVKRKKYSVCKYLKKDIVDLLNNKLDYNAYGRAEGLIEEKRRLSCYESLEQFCICVASNVSLLQKSSRCPDECCEAISSLVYAAARVSEVPELRDLRSLFADRYGNALEEFVSHEFVERFKLEPPSKEMKIELLREIAREYSIKWDAKSLEQRLYTPPSHNVSLSFHSSVDEEENKSIMSATSEDDSMSTTDTCEEDYRFMPAPYKIEKQESLPGKFTTTDSPKLKPRSVRRRFANPPPIAEDSSGEGNRRMCRRTASWQSKTSNVPDFDEVAARVDALTRY